MELNELEVIIRETIQTAMKKNGFKRAKGQDRKTKMIMIFDQLPRHSEET